MLQEFLKLNYLHAELPEHFALNLVHFHSRKATHTRMLFEVDQLKPFFQISTDCQSLPYSNSL